MVIDADIIAELRRARMRAGFMLLVSAFGLTAFDSVVAFVALAVNAAVWLVRFWYYTSQIYEHALIIDGGVR